MNLVKYFYYLKPKNSFIRNIKHTTKTIFNLKKRKIFHIENSYSEEDWKAINQLREKINQSSYKIPEQYKFLLSDGELLKYVRCSKTIDNAFERMQQKILWMDKHSNSKLSESSINILKKGIIHFGGYDKLCRPILILNIDKIDYKNEKKEHFIDALRFCFDIMEQQIFVPSKVENCLLFVDTNYLSLLSFPFSIMNNIINTMTYYYPGTLCQLYVTKPSLVCYYSWKFIEKVIPEDCNNEVKLLREEEYKDLHDKIDVNQLSQQFGGNLQLQKFWPPTNTLSQKSKFLEKVISVPQMSKSQNNTKSRKPLINYGDIFKKLQFNQIKMLFQQTKPFQLLLKN